MKTNAKPQKKTIAKDLVGAAGVHYVASVLSIRGMIALPTIKNTAGYDLIVVSSDGTKHANIQVKTSQNPKAKFWPMPKLEQVRAGPNDYYVFVRRQDETFEAFMITGAQARSALEKHRQKYEEKCAKGPQRPEFPCVWLEKPDPKQNAEWSSKWKNWNINKSVP
jgi:hypothetical protein